MICALVASRRSGTTLRNIIGELLTEVGHNVAIEPLLQPLTGEVFRARSTATLDEARSDIRATGFWSRREDAFFNVRVFHANAPSNRTRTLQEACRHHEHLKQLHYEE